MLYGGGAESKAGGTRRGTTLRLCLEIVAQRQGGSLLVDLVLTGEKMTAGVGPWKVADDDIFGVDAARFAIVEGISGRLQQSEGAFRAAAVPGITNDAENALARFLTMHRHEVAQLSAMVRRKGAQHNVIDLGRVHVLPGIEAIGVALVLIRGG